MADSLIDYAYPWIVETIGFNATTKPLYRKKIHRNDLDATHAHPQHVFPVPKRKPEAVALAHVKIELPPNQLSILCPGLAPRGGTSG
jgi:hypothetical protein